MKNIIKFLVAAAALGTASVASATMIPASGSVYLENTPYDGGLNGGEFKANIAGFGEFYTFCMELTQTINLPGTYNFTSSNAVDSNGDVLSKGTAYLFQQFTLGNLFNRNGTLGNTSAGAGGKANIATNSHDFNSGLLQAAIWYLEDEVVTLTSGGVDFITGNPFIAQVISKFGDLAGAKANYTGDKVAVLNVTTAGGAKRQDVLISVPDSGTTLALLGFAVVSLATIRRRFRG